MKTEYEVLIIGGGPAGLASAVSAVDNGAKDVLLVEREDRLGGILNQCIHNGFGLARFKTSLSGPEYADRYVQEIKKRNVETLLSTAVVSVDKDKKATLINRKQGVFTVRAKSIILAMGCRERSRGTLNVAGERPAGVFSAGTAQKYVNMNGYLPGKNVVIVGSGDIGLVMARRMTLEGAKVHAVCEIMPTPSGLRRNIVQCLEDFNIPLYVSHTVTRIDGEERVTGVEITRVDKDLNPIAGTEIYISCDTVLYSVGLIPENEISKSLGVELSENTRGATVTQSRETNLSGVFACGNVLHVHDLVDFVSEEAEIAGKYACQHAINGTKPRECVNIELCDGISYVVPQIVDKSLVEGFKIYFRVKKTLTDCVIALKSGDTVLSQRKKRIVVPAEMETVIVSADKIAQIKNGLQLVLEVQK